MLDDHWEVVKSIQESCGGAEDFPSVCETLLQAHAGINLNGFSGFLAHCAAQEEILAGCVRGDDADAVMSCAFRLAVLRSSIQQVMELPHAKWLAGRGLLQGDAEAEQAVLRGLKVLATRWVDEERSTGSGNDGAAGVGGGKGVRLLLESLAAFPVR